MNHSVFSPSRSGSHLTSLAPDGPAGPVNANVISPGAGGLPAVYTRVASPII